MADKKPTAPARRVNAERARSAERKRDDALVRVEDELAKLEPGERETARQLIEHPDPRESLVKLRAFLELRALRSEPEPTEWTDRDKHCAEFAARDVIKRKGQHLTESERESVKQRVLEALLTRPRGSVREVYYSAEVIAKRLCRETDVVYELAKLEERLREKARSDLLTGHVARIVRALRLAAANIRERRDEPEASNAKSVHRSALDALDRPALDYLAKARSSWAGVDPVMKALGDDEPIGHYSFYTPTECEDWAESPGGEGYLEQCLADGRSIPSDPHAIEYDDVNGRRLPRTARAWLFIDSFVSLITSNGIGVMDEDHAAMSLEGQKMEARIAVAQLGPKRQTQPRAIMRAILDRFGSTTAETLFRARDRDTSRQHAKKRHSVKVSKRK